jgi:hypothetical protein
MGGMGPRQLPWRFAVLGCAVAAVAAAAARDAGQGVGPDQIVGTWRGTSTCTDRVAAPACRDETVVYEFTPGRGGTVHWTADKVVDGRRERMGEFDLSFDRAEACWKVEFSSPRVRGVWRLAVDGSRMTGSARLLPGNEKVRTLDLRKDR